MVLRYRFLLFHQTWHVELHSASRVRSWVVPIPNGVSINFFAMDDGEVSFVYDVLIS